MILMIGLSRLCELDLIYPPQSRKVDILFEQNVLRIQVAIYYPSLIQKTETIEKLLRKNSNKGCAETSKLVLFDQFVQVDAQQFEH